MKRTVLVLLGLALAGMAHASDPGTVIKADQLKAEPYKDARTLSSLAKDDKVEILKKQGGWLQVKSGRGSGWVRLLSVRRGGPSNRSSAEGVLKLATGRAAGGQIVSTTGIRGLDEEDLKAAKFNADALKTLDGYAAGRDGARRHASQAKLAARKVDPLPVPVQARPQTE